MTSGHFHSVPIDSIQVNREGRQRRELNGIEGLEGLAKNIESLGLINPIVVTHDLVLVAGERRVAACRRLGWTHISAQFTDEVEEHVLQAIELAENIKREQLPWKDECLAIYKYCQLRKSADPELTQTELGEELGRSQNALSEKLAVARELLAGNQRIIDADKFSTAVGIARRQDERAAALEEFQRLTRNPRAPVVPDPILNVDFNEWAKTYDGPRFNFVHCDFPYGIESDSFNQGSAGTHGGYEDTPQTRSLGVVGIRRSSQPCRMPFLRRQTETSTCRLSQSRSSETSSGCLWMSSL
jgi:ParB/RepB/Spo0J family partition protein